MLGTLEETEINNHSTLLIRQCAVLRTSRRAAELPFGREHLGLGSHPLLDLLHNTPRQMPDSCLSTSRHHAESLSFWNVLPSISSLAILCVQSYKKAGDHSTECATSGCPNITHS